MSRAFDTIDRGKLLNDLSDILEPDELHLVKLLLIDVKIQVKHNDCIGKTFTPDIGSPQGDCASPIWFIFYLHNALESIKSKLDSPRDVTLDIAHDHSYIKQVDNCDHTYSKPQKKPITKCQNTFLIDQQYADDASWAAVIKPQIEIVKSEAPTVLKEENNLLINEDKTEEYSVNRHCDPAWKTCKLVGSLLGNEEDIKRRKKLACNVFHQNKNVLCSSDIYLKTRIRIFKALVASIFLYNCELWSLTKANTRRIDTFQRSLLRQIIRTRRCSNKHLYTICGIEPWSNVVKHRRLSWFGHMLRLPADAPARLAYQEARRPYKKTQGGQRTNWLSTVRRDFKELNIELKDAENIAHKRDEYSQLIGSAMASGSHTITAQAQ